MERVAVFVDAGYLFAQGSTAISGRKRARVDLALSPRAVVDELKALALVRAPDCSLLRIYWYDGAVTGAQPTSEQTLVAQLDDVKLRLGFINSAGQQKGVDSLIVTDLIELARQRAICDAILLSGDEDVRVGVQIAQNYGVRIHLLGIVPARGSQSRQLLQEADTTSEWDELTVNKFLSLRAAVSTVTEVAIEVVAPAREPSRRAKAALQDAAEGEKAILAACVASFVSGLEHADLRAIQTYWSTNRGVPSDFDRKLLAQSRDAIKRELESEEKIEMRASFRGLVTARLVELA